MTDDERRERIGAAFKAIDDVFVVPAQGEARMAGRVAYFHLVHLRDLFEGVIVLLGRNRAHGAFILGRSMFETSLMLGALEEPSTRDAIAMRWFQESADRAPSYIQSVAEVTDDEVADAREVLRANQRRLAEARAELGIGKLPGKLIAENAAKAQGREDDLPNYLAAHDFTHGAYSALKIRVVHHEDEERSTFHLDQRYRLDVQEAAANFAARSALLGYRSACRIFELPEPKSLVSLLEFVEFDDA